MGRILGLDYGTRRIGVAISDSSHLIANGYGVIDATAGDVEDALRKIVTEEGVERIIVGLPVGLSGREGPLAEAARSFAERVEASTGIPVEMADERYTTKLAESALLEAGMRRRARKEVRDKVAAAVMLQTHLDSQK